MSQPSNVTPIKPPLPQIEEVKLFIGVKVAGNWVHYEVAGQGPAMFGLGQMASTPNPPPRDRSRPEPAPVVSSDTSCPLSNYVIRYGKKFQGKRLGECDMYALANYFNWLHDDAYEKGEPLVGIKRETAEAIDSYLKLREFKRRKPGPRPR